MVQKRTVARFELWRQVPGNVDRFLEMLEKPREGEEGKSAYVSFRDACHELRLPYLLMYRMVHDTPELLERYEGILRARSHHMVEQTVEIADEVEPDRDHVAKAKLQVEVRQAAASYWDRERYGQRIQVEKSVNVTVDAGLLGRAAELLGEVEVPERVVEGETLTLPELPDAEPR
jgi:hypothetical protein